MNIEELKNNCEKNLNNHNESVRVEHKLVLDIIKENKDKDYNVNKLEFEKEELLLLNLDLNNKLVKQVLNNNKLKCCGNCEEFRNYHSGLICQLDTDKEVHPCEVCRKWHLRGGKKSKP